MDLRAGAISLLVTLLLAPAAASAQPARELYARALAREREVRDAERGATLIRIRGAISAYERVVRRYPASGYADNALWQAGHLALLAFERFGEARDRESGIRFLKLLESDYRSSSLARQVPEAIAAFNGPEKPRPVRAASPPPAVADPPASTPPSPSAAAPGDPVTIRGIKRTTLPDGVRISIEMDRELLFRHEQLENPRRVFFDLRGAKPAPALVDATLRYGEDVVREIRLGRHPNQTTRVVMDMEGVDSFSVFTLYSPYRVIVDFKRSAAVPPVVNAAAVSSPTLPLIQKPPTAVATSGPSTALATAPPPTAPAAKMDIVKIPDEELVKPPIPSRPTVALASPAVPSTNSNGQFSLARQLGLGISRIVLDPGHGGHDPGAHGGGQTEAALVLDVAQRLKRLLENQPGMEVVMTRDRDVFIPLEERTAFANKQNADLFLSIHANASRNPKARGVETYFLNFASNPEAEAVAARENSASGRTMHSLPDIVRAIALNNKIDESRDFADTIQKSMVRRLSARNKELRDLGVKQAPFVVLIGAGMPSVLAEISFVTHKQEGQLLKTAAYRQTIAEALFDAVVRYQRSLKAKTTIAARDE